MKLLEFIRFLINRRLERVNLSLDNVHNSSFLADYGGGTNIIYKAYAKTGTFTFESRWQIAKINYNGSGEILSIQWPIDNTGRSSSAFKFKWDDRAIYNYRS
jgi:hypothetical protein